MSEVKSVLVIGVSAGILLAIILNADNAVKVIDSVSKAYFGLINTAAGANVKKATV
jgi:hypothetical protein